jgi:hypothetical protein
MCGDGRFAFDAIDRWLGTLGFESRPYVSSPASDFNQAHCSLGHSGEEALVVFGVVAVMLGRQRHCPNGPQRAGSRADAGDSNLQEAGAFNIILQN